MTWLSQGRTNTFRVFGFDWLIEWEVWKHDLGEGGEFLFVHMGDSINGGSYFITHVEETGEWQISEAGGAGDRIWENELPGLFPSPLEAMREIRRHEAYEEEQLRRWEEEMYRGMYMTEEEAQRIRTHGESINEL